MIFPKLLAHEVPLEWANTKITTYFTDNDKLCPPDTYLCKSYVKNNMLHCEIYFRTDNFPSQGEICHECLHAVYASLRHIGMEKINENNEELVAHLVDWLVDEVNLFINEVVKSYNPVLNVCNI